jgi:hypothetical protein
VREKLKGRILKLLPISSQTKDIFTSLLPKPLSFLMLKLIEVKHDKYFAKSQLARILPNLQSTQAMEKIQINANNIVATIRASS